MKSFGVAMVALFAPAFAAGADAPAAEKAMAEVGPVTKHMDIAAMAFVFVLATSIGVGVIRRVSRLLHTPLMSLTNAISAIAVVGAILITGDDHYPTYVRVLGAIALFASMTNIISGFLITQRMLRMFKTQREPSR